MKSLFVALCFMVCLESQAQQVTTFILVRHAEKKSDGSKDPELTEAGLIRAKLLGSILRDTQINAVYSTPFKRTQETVEPLAASKGLTIKTYAPLKSEQIDEMLKTYPGGTILISGHSNTIPWTANYLLGKDEFRDFDDADYDNILIVDVTEKGKIAKATWLSY